jgi:hypothetical protein
MPFWRNYVPCKLQTKFALLWIENQHYITTVHHSLLGSFRDVRFRLTDTDSITYILCKKTHNACTSYSIYMKYTLNDLWWCTQLMKTGISSDSSWHKQVITRTWHRTYSEPDKFITFHTFVSLTVILILTSNLCLGLPSTHFSLGFIRLQFLYMCYHSHVYHMSSQTCPPYKHKQKYGQNIASAQLLLPIISWRTSQSNSKPVQSTPTHRHVTQQIIKCQKYVCLFICLLVFISI